MLANLRALSLFLLGSFASLAAARVISPLLIQRNQSVVRRSADGTGASYWLSQTQDILNSVQESYYAINHWPTTIHWIASFVNTLIAATETSLSSALTSSSGSDAQAQAIHEIKEQIVQHYFQVESHYNGEAADQMEHEAYDDIQWVVLEWLEVIRFIQQYNAHVRPPLGVGDEERFGQRAFEFYSLVQDKFDTSNCKGGLTWDPKKRTYKNAITNELFVASSVDMYLYWPGYKDAGLRRHDSRFLNNAKKAYEWLKSHNFKNNIGLIVDGFHISEGQTSCNLRNDMTYTYNQGVVLSGLRGLWEATGDAAYLNDAYELINSVIAATGFTTEDPPPWDPSEWRGMGRNGTLQDHCDAGGKCNRDQRMFKGIFFHHLSHFCEPLPTQAPLANRVIFTADEDQSASHQAACNGYIPWIERDANAALNSIFSSGNMDGDWNSSSDDKKRDLSALNAAPAPLPRIETPDGRSEKHGRMIPRSLQTRRPASDKTTLETQASVLGVLKAAFDLTRWRDNQSSS